MTKIEWTESTWNPVTGCTKKSAGCLNCYAERMAKRLQAMGQPNYINGFEPTFHEHVLERPLQLKKSKMIFVNSMSDTFHEKLTDSEILRIFSVMNESHWHKFQVLTKRSERLRSLSKEINWTPNIWVGVTVENANVLYRIGDLKQINANVKFLSIEPLIGALPDLNLSNIDWVIVGGESGPGARPMQKEWVEIIKNSCIEQQVPFFFKQWGGVNKKKNGRLLNDQEWNGMPND